MGIIYLTPLANASLRTTFRRCDLRIPVILLALSLAGAVAAQERTDQQVFLDASPYVPALVTGAYDGDTLTITAKLWPGLEWSGSVRVRGVDTPEIAGECDQEKRWAVASRDFVRDLLTDETILLLQIEDDKYGGRVLAFVAYLSEGGDNLLYLHQTLIDGNYGRAYGGGERGDWCDEMLPMPSLMRPALPTGTTTATGTDTSTDDEDDPYADPNHPLTLYDDNRNGRISCAEARAHGIAPVYEQTPDVDGDEPYDFMSDPDGDGVVCEAD